MSKKRKQPIEAAQRGIASSALWIGGICLALGLVLGYYGGQRTGGSPGPVPPAAPGGPPPLNPAAFAADEARLRSIVRSNPRDLEAIIRLGNLYYDHGQFRDAVAWYGRALDLDPRNVNVRTDRGTSYWNLGNAEAAIAEFQKSLERDPAHPQTLYNLGVVYLHGKNDPAAARGTWQNLLAKNPNYPERASLEARIASLGPAPAEANPPSPRPASNTEGVADLLERLKSRP